MNFPPFWSRGVHGAAQCWRWSHRSLDEARALAAEAARQLAERFDEEGFAAARYGYGDRPLREPVLREFKDQAGATSAVITRNAQGCLVLNTARLLFVDVDAPAAEARGGLLKRLFGGAKASPAHPAEAEVLARAETWIQSRPDWGWRVYRTRAGWRLAATHALFEPGDAASTGAFAALEADPLYRQLCERQQCFRARLTPKPWRCGLHERPARWPWPDAPTEARFKDWEQRYLQACEGHATCDFIATLGQPKPHPEVQPLLAVHDAATSAESRLPLA